MSRIISQFENLSTDIPKDGSGLHGVMSFNMLGIVPLAERTVDTAGR